MLTIGFVGFECQVFRKQIFTVFDEDNSEFKYDYYYFTKKSDIQILRGVRNLLQSDDK